MSDTAFRPLALRQFVGLRPCAVSAHIAVKRLWLAMHEQRVGVLDMAALSGVNKNTFNEWFRGRSSPTLENLEACLNVLGLTLTTVKSGGSR